MLEHLPSPSTKGGRPSAVPPLRKPPSWMGLARIEASLGGCVATWQCGYAAGYMAVLLYWVYGFRAHAPVVDAWNAHGSTGLNDSGHDNVMAWQENYVEIFRASWIYLALVSEPGKMCFRAQRGLGAHFNDNFQNGKGHKLHTYLLIDISLVDRNVHFPKSLCLTFLSLRIGNQYSHNLSIIIPRYCTPTCFPKSIELQYVKRIRPTLQPNKQKNVNRFSRKGQLHLESSWKYLNESEKNLETLCFDKTRNL